MDDRLRLGGLLTIAAMCRLSDQPHPGLFAVEDEVYGVFTEIMKRLTADWEALVGAARPRPHTAEPAVTAEAMFR